MVIAAAVLFLVGCWFLEYRRDTRDVSFSWPKFGMALGAIGLFTAVVLPVCLSAWGQAHPGSLALVVMALMIALSVVMGMVGLRMKTPGVR